MQDSAGTGWNPGSTSTQVSDTYKGHNSNVMVHGGLDHVQKKVSVQYSTI